MQTLLGLLVKVEVKRSTISESESDAANNSGINAFKFEILLPRRYPFCDPQVTCQTDFADPALSLTDGRDLFNEIVGDEWKIGHKLHSLIEFLPVFIHEMLDISNTLRVVGTFHLGQVYDL